MVLEVLLSLVTTKNIKKKKKFYISIPKGTREEPVLIFFNRDSVWATILDMVMLLVICPKNMILYKLNYVHANFRIRKCSEHISQQQNKFKKGWITLGILKVHQACILRGKWRTRISIVGKRFPSYTHKSSPQSWLNNDKGRFESMLNRN